MSSQALLPLSSLDLPLYIHMREAGGPSPIPGFQSTSLGAQVLGSIMAIVHARTHTHTLKDRPP